jgi:hypothetical protein
MHIHNNVLTFLIKNTKAEDRFGLFGTGHVLN